MWRHKQTRLLLLLGLLFAAYWVSAVIFVLKTLKCLSNQREETTLWTSEQTEKVTPRSQGKQLLSNPYSAPSNYSADANIATEIMSEYAR